MTDILTFKPAESTERKVEELQHNTSTMSNGPPPAAQEKINTDIVTLTRYLNEEQVKHKEATGDFTYV